MTWATAVITQHPTEIQRMRWLKHKDWPESLQSICIFGLLL